MYAFAGVCSLFTHQGPVTGVPFTEGEEVGVSDGGGMRDGKRSLP